MSPIENLEARLAALDNSFKSAPSEGGTFYNDLPEPGEYQAVLRSIDFFESKAGAALLKLIFEVVLSKDYMGHEIGLLYNLEPEGTPQEIEQRLSFLKRDLKTLGIPVDQEDFAFSDVRPGSPIWDDVMDVPVAITVKEGKKLDPKTGRPRINAYLDARLGDPLPGNQALQFGSDMGADTTPPVPSVTDGDGSIPF
jgi:hypothetical protein